MIHRLYLMLCLLLCSSAVSLGCGGKSAFQAKSGSMARFITREGHLYALDGWELKVFRIADNVSPQPVAKIPIQNFAETLFPHGPLLYLGTRQGMLVYSLEHPDVPELIGRAEHLYSCDPVVVQGDIAYVTLRSGNLCRTGENLLMIFDVSNPTEPRHVNSVPMSNPHGLAVDGHLLFVTDSKDGLVVLDVSDPQSLRLLGKVHMSGYDAIADAGILYISAKDGLYQYRYTYDLEISFVELSRIPIGEKVTIGESPKNTELESEQSPVPSGIKYDTK